MSTHRLEGISHSFRHDEPGRLSAELLLFPNEGIGLRNTDIYDRVRSYYLRHLSYGSDSLNAVEGVLRAFDYDRRGASRAKHFYGIPITYEAGFERSRSRANGTAAFVAGLTWRSEFQDKGEIEAVTEKQVTNENKQHIFPSWSWAAIKAAHPTRGAQLHLDRNCVPHQDNIAITITRQDGECFDVSDFISSLRPVHYSQFLPRVNISTWAIEGILKPATSKSNRSLNLLGMAGEVLMDDEILNTSEVVALFLGYKAGRKRTRSYRVVTLLVHMNAGGTYRRVGMWQTTIPFFGGFQGVTEDVQGLLNCSVTMETQVRNKWTRGTFVVE